MTRRDLVRLAVAGAALVAFWCFWHAASARYEPPFSHAQWKLLGATAVIGGVGVYWWGSTSRGPT